MSDLRISRDNNAPPTAHRGEALTIHVDGRPVQAYAGETVATVLVAMGYRRFRLTEKDGRPRGIFCGMGICFDCLVTIDGVPNARACMTPVEAGMRVTTAAGGTNG